MIDVRGVRGWLERGILLGLCVIGSVACASSRGAPGRTSGDLVVVYPTPPDTPRIQFLLTLSNEADLKGQSSPSFLETIVGEDGEDVRLEINKPYGVDLYDGTLYVCDTMAGGLKVIDLEERTFEIFRPRGPGTLRKPINCHVDPRDGRLYVADSERGQIVVFDSTRSYETAFAEGEGMRPVDVTVDGDNVWVVDIDGRAVRMYDRATNQLVKSFPSPDAEATEALFQPTNLAVRNGLVYVSDFGDFKVKIYTEDGDYVSSVGSFGRTLGQFVRPKGVAVDQDGLLYVVDAGFENVQVFNREGQLLMFFGGPYEGPGDMWLPAKVVIRYHDLEIFQPYVDSAFDLKYLILVTNQYGPDRINVYGFIEPKQPVAADDVS